MKLTQSEFIERSRVVHGDKYDYSKSSYRSMSKPVCIVCPTHGEFYQRPLNHIHQRHGCPKCRIEKRIKPISEYIKRAKAIHRDKYDYSQVQIRVVNDKAQIICPIHGVFEQSFMQHLLGRGCPKCANAAQRSLVYGVGINDSEEGGIKSKFYTLWTGMLWRCYKSGCNGYKDVSVCNEWLTFSNFKDWCEKSENNYQEGYHLDKDILIKGNKIYSPQTCCFVPVAINGLLVGRHRSRKRNFIGVQTEGKHGYSAHLTKFGKSHRIGPFKTERDAFVAYKRAKEEYIKEVAKEYYSRGEITKRVYDALIQYEVDVISSHSDIINCDNR